MNDKTKVIVVEDNIVYCEFVCNLLAREGFCTVQAFHLSTAKKLLQQTTENDIIVSDLRLPEGDGIDLLRWMRKEGMMQPFIIINAPLTCPKNADGASSLESEPQSTATNGFPARLLLSCSWCAICSLPVPFSPNISTLMSVGATSLIRFMMA